MTHRILHVEDEPNYRTVLALMLADRDIEIVEAKDGEEALEVLAKHDVDLIITDVNMPRMDGLALLATLAQRAHAPPVIVVTAYGSVDVAVRAMRGGAIDFLEKPFDEARLKLTLDRALALTSLLHENARLRSALEERFDFSQVIGSSPPLLAALETAGKAAKSEAPILVRGESGTGKELVARAIHFNSPRRHGPFVAVNCAAIPENLLESEVFGVRPGAFTGAVKAKKGRLELASHGTLFLDEIGDMPLSLQAKLLRVLQEKTFMPLGGEREEKADVRFVFATHRDLSREVAEHRFREDLYYRVAVVPIELPPLRARGDDVIALALAFAEDAARRMGRPAVRLTEDARRALRTASFPGNVRELANVVERAVILGEGEAIEAADLALAPALPGAMGTQSSATSAPVGPFALPSEGVSLEAVERSLIEQALARTDGNKSQAARLLGLTRATLRYRIEKLGLE